MKLLLIGFTWVGFFALHSYTATDSFKERFRGRFPKLFPAYRLLYNLLALATVCLPLGLMLDYHGPDVIAPADLYTVFDRLLQLIAVAGFFWALFSYDLAEFLGTKALRQPLSATEGSLRTTGALGWCRHPLYFFGLVLIWTGSHNAATLLSAALATVYIFYGIQVEERRLVAHFGETYRRYQAEVPMLIPRPRWLRRTGRQPQ